MRERGITLFIAIMVTGTLLLVASTLVNLASKQAVITASARDSQFAFYAADTGLECALYWDVANPAGKSAFTAPFPNNISCASANITINSPVSFTINFAPQSYCAVVTVTKLGTVTTIQSKGYNTCDTTNPRRVERAVRAVY